MPVRERLRALDIETSNLLEASRLTPQGEKEGTYFSFGGALASSLAAIGLPATGSMPLSEPSAESRSVAANESGRLQDPGRAELYFNSSDAGLGAIVRQLGSQRADDASLSSKSSSLLSSRGGLQADHVRESGDLARARESINLAENSELKAVGSTQNSARVTSRFRMPLPHPLLQLREDTAPIDEAKPQSWPAMVSVNMRQSQRSR